MRLAKLEPDCLYPFGFALEDYDPLGRASRRHPAPVGCFADRLYPDSGRSQRGLLAGLRSRGLRPAHSCGVEAQRLLLLVGSLYLFRPRAHPSKA